MVRAIKTVVCTVERLTADAYRVEVEKPCLTNSRETDGGTGECDQIGDVASVERELENALVLNNCADCRSACLNERGIGLNLDLLGYLTDLQGRINHWTAVDLQNDSGLHKGAKSRQSCF